MDKLCQLWAVNSEWKWRECDQYQKGLQWREQVSEEHQWKGRETDVTGVLAGNGGIEVHTYCIPTLVGWFNYW